MNDDAPSGNCRKNIWAPWRMPYIESLSETPARDEGGCFLCAARDAAACDATNLVLWRGKRALTVLNRYPYTGGHSMIAPRDHVAEMGELDDATLTEMMRMVVDIQTVLRKAVNAQGFNVGVNIGRCAGAGLPGHLHVHVVPRWGGDTNFMAVLDDVRVVPTSLDEIYNQLTATAKALHLPRSGGGA